MAVRRRETTEKPQYELNEFVCVKLSIVAPTDYVTDWCPGQALKGFAQVHTVIPRLHDEAYMTPTYSTRARRVL